MLTGGVDIAKYNDEPGDGQRYDIRVKGREGEFLQPADLAKIYLRNREGTLVRLDSVATFRETLGPAVIGRFDLQYSATFYATPTMPLGEAVEKLRALGTDLPPGYQIKLIGQAEEFAKTTQYMAFASCWRCSCSTWCWPASSTRSCNRSSSCSPSRWPLLAASPRCGLPARQSTSIR
jgi:HAE1 family hydrophobic/amphiphilic exporter-1